MKEEQAQQKTHIAWIKNTGIMPDCKKALVKFNSGVVLLVSPGSYSWALDRFDPIKAYAILDEDINIEKKTYIVWMPYTGEPPVCKTAVLKFNDGHIDIAYPIHYDWDNIDPIKEYAIIEE